MSDRALKALLGTVAGLFILWLAVTFLPMGGQGGGTASETLTGFFDGADGENLTSIRMFHPGEGGSVELIRTGGSWEVNGFRVDSAGLGRFFEALGNSEIGDLVAANPANHARMGVAEDSTLVLELGFPDGSRSLLVGDAGPRYGTTYARLPGEDQVHLLTGGLRSYLTRSVDDWRNKRVASVDTATVGRIEVVRVDGGFVVNRSDSIWVFEDGAQARSTAVNGMLGEMSRLEATGFYSATDSLAAQEAVVRALDGQGGVLLTLEIGSGDGDRWLRREGDSIVYRLPSWRASRLLPDLESVTGGG